MFQRSKERFINLVLKTKQQKAFQQPYVFINKFVIHHRFVIIHFSDLWKISQVCGEYIYSLFNMKVV